MAMGSDDEFGDDILEDFDTEATVPLSHPIQWPRKPNIPLQSSPQVEVLVSSPTGPSSHPPRTSYRATSTSPSLLNGSRVGLMMAPPGTRFRPPPTYSQTPSVRGRSDTADYLTQDEKSIVNLSSDEERAARSIATGTGFKKTTFVRNGLPMDRQVSRVQESPVKNTFSQFVYQPQPAKRSADAMADSYGSSWRGTKTPRQSAPAKALPVTTTITSNMTMDDIQDHQNRDKVDRMRRVFPKATVAQCMNALERRNYHCEDAMDIIADEGDDSSAAGEPKAVDLTLSDDELQNTKSRQATKRGVANVKSIQEKWARTKPRDFVRSKSQTDSGNSTIDSLSPPLAARKRKLIRPQRTYSPTRSSPIANTATLHQIHIREQTPVYHSKRSPDQGVVIDVSDDDSSDVASISSSDSPAAETELLEFLNKCTYGELDELVSLPRETVERVLKDRPYRSLDQVRAIVTESRATTKKGKERITTKDVGNRLVDVCLEVFQTYNTIDKLVGQCEDLGRPVREEMSRIGLATARSGEMEATDFDGHDSGIGTPSSSVAGDDDSARKPVRLTQPRTMSKELVMKDYQIIGLNWLASLFSKKMSGILADDMGLGKTCQVIAFLTHLVESGKASGPHVVIVPGSTLENWLREFRNFSPKLDVRPYYGAQSERSELQFSLLADRDEVNVVVTTYDMAVAAADNKFFRRLNPVICVFDEGHALKNSKSARYQQLMRIPADFRLLLTGTPLQNNLQELVSLLAFIMPDVFREHQEDLALLFKHKAKTTDNSGTAALLSAERISRARSMMTPFILRRKKEQVMKHLPAKNRRVQYCDMTESQAELYADEAKKASALFGNDAGAPLSIKQKTNVMMDLRKAAIHPLLFRREYDDVKLKTLARLYMQGDHVDAMVEEHLVEEDLTVMTDFELDRFCKQQGRRWKPHVLENDLFMNSGKVAELVGILKCHIAKGDRTLVFSQFTMVMDILEEVFALESITFSRLDGSTKMSERQDMIDQFAADESISVFMLSTKAGGAGINLACANKVIIFDSSFNPQDDVQAENRAHRVGQTREVEVVRLVTKGTIEEQIMALGLTKLALDSRVAGGDAAADGKNPDAAAELEGMAMVEKMLKDGIDPAATIEEGGETAAPSEGTAVMGGPLHSSLARQKSDLKDEFMKGLKGAGLKMEG